MSKSVRDIRANIWINDKTGGKTLRELNSEARKLRNELAHLPKGTSEFAEKSKRLREVQSGMRQIREEISGVGFSWQKAADKFNRYTGLIGAGIAAVAGVVLTLKNWLDGSAKLADAQADVAKTTGLTNAELATLQERLGTINTRSSRLELLKLAEEAGRLGKTSVSEIEGFVRVADQLKVALGDDLGGEEAIRDVGKLTEIYRVGTKHGTNFEQSMLKLGSAINEVSASGANQAGYLVDYLKRLAGISTQTTLTAEQQIGYAAAFDESGQQVETSATAMSKVITNMFKDTATYAEIAGVSQEDFSKLLREDTNEALLLFLQGLNGNNEGLEVMAQKMDGLGLDGARAVATLASLAGNLDLVRTRQSQANVAMVEGTSLTNEFNKKNENLAGNLEKIRRALYGKFISSTVVDSLTAFTSKLAEMTEVPVSETLEKERVKLRMLELQLYDTNTPQEERIKIINELKKQYPGYMGHLDADTVSNQELSAAIQSVNDQLINKIILQKQDEKINAHNEKVATKRMEIFEREERLRERMIKLAEKQGIEFEKSGTVYQQASEVYSKAQDAAMKGVAFNEKAKLGHQIAELENAYETLEILETNNNDLLNEKNALMERLGISIQEIDQKLQGNQDAQEETTETTEEETNKRKGLTEEEKKALEEYLEKKKDANQEIQDFLNKLNDDELEDTKRRFEKLLEMADKYKLDRTAIEQAMQEELRRIRYEAINRDSEEEQKRLKSLADSSMESAWKATQEAIYKQAEEEGWSEYELTKTLHEAEMVYLQEKKDAYTSLGIDVSDIVIAIYQLTREMREADNEHDEEVIKNQIERRLQLYRQIEQFAGMGMNTVGAMRDFELAGLEQVSRRKGESEEAYTIRKEENERKRQQIVKRYAVAEALMKVAQITSSTAEAVTKAYAASPLTLGMPWSAILGAMGAVQIATAIRQAAAIRSYHVGGYTGTGLGIPDPNVPGQYIAGVVHGNEYVVPEFTLKDPDVQHMVRIIEMKRTGQMVGYQDGGFTNSSSSTSAAPFNAETSSYSPNLEPLLLSTQAALNALIRKLDSPIEAHFTKRTVRDITEQQEKNSVMRNRNKLS